MSEEKKVRKFKIHTGERSCESWVEMDGERLEGVTSVSFELTAHSLTHLTLKVLGEVEVDGQFVERNLVDVKTAACRCGREVVSDTWMPTD